MDNRLAQLEQKTGAEFSVVILNLLEGGQIDDFANKLFNKWGVGQKGKNNGVMLLVAMQDRKARVEAGYGLEPILPDALAGRVLDEELFPAFKQGQYAQGLAQAVSRISSIIERNQPASPAERQGGKPADIIAPTLMFLLLFVAAGFAAVGAGVGTRQFFMVIWGLFFGGIAMFMAWVAGGWWGWLLLVPGTIMFVVGWHAARSSGANDLSKKRSGAGWTWMSSGLSGFVGGLGGGFGGGGFGGGGFGGGGGGFGGFGGGCSGGGGASGGW